VCQLQDCRDDSTGLRDTIRPLVSCERRGWLQSHIANSANSDWQFQSQRNWEAIGE